ncbi:MAG: flagellin [Alphaproteobacteria bacterium]|nr:flagellin [Alphaproteobacteria bacterium]
MVERISTTGGLIFTRNQIQANNAKYEELQYQIATGRKYDQLKDYGTSATRILDLSNEIAAREAYKRSIDLTELTANAYDTTLERMVDILDDLVNAAEPISVDDTNWASDNQILGNNLLLDFQTNINMEIGGRYIFGGTNFTTPPVKDLRSLSTYTTNDLPPTAVNTIETASQLPQHLIDSGGTNTIESYMTNFSGTGTIDFKAWEKVEVTVAPNQTIEYGIVATDQAFQNAVEALLRFKSATQSGLTTDQRNEFLNQARSLADSTRSELRHLQAGNGIFLTEIKNAKELHESFITISEIALDKITVADSAQAATEMSALQTMIQASYQVISKRSQLSLINYI